MWVILPGTSFDGHFIINNTTVIVIPVAKIIKINAANKRILDGLLNGVVKMSVDLLISVGEYVGRSGITSSWHELTFSFISELIEFSSL